MSAPRCLIIDPDPQFAYILSGIISRHGIDVAITGDPIRQMLTGIAAHDLYHTGQIQLIRRLQNSEPA